MTRTYVSFPLTRLMKTSITFRTFQCRYLRTKIINFTRAHNVVIWIDWGQHTNVPGADLHGQLSQVGTASTQRLSEAGLLLLQELPRSL